MSTVLELSDDKILDIFQQLRVAYQLKRTLRYNTMRDFSVHSESVGEHVFALHFLARYFVRVEVLPHRLDMEKVGDIITFHDFGEIPGGDKPYIFKTKEDEEQEKLDAAKVFSMLPEELRTVAKESWEDYEAKGSLEAQFVNALDKLEPCFELHDPVNEKTLRRLGYTYDAHVDKKLRATEKFPVMRRFVLATSLDKRERGLFVDGPTVAG